MRKSFLFFWFSLIIGAWQCPSLALAQAWMPPLPEGTNVILVSIDNLRPDRLGAYGETRPTSPLFDRLAAESVVFENAYATAPWTLPSHMSMFSGLHPKSHRAVASHSQAAPDIPMLTEILREQGYRAFASTGGGYVGPGFGFGRGFEGYEIAWAPERVVRNALAWLTKADQNKPYFFFLHTFGVHCPFAVAPRYRRLFDRRPAEDHIEVKGKCGDTHYSKMNLTDGQIAFVSDRYDAGIRRTDDALQSFLQFLEKSGALDRSVLIITSDHGEEFAEHGRMGHGRALYAESLRVPLLIRIPGVAPQRVRTPVSLVDLAPTVLDLLGRSSEGMEGKSLAPLFADGNTASAHRQGRPLYAETELSGEKGRTVIFNGHQLIIDKAKKQTEIFDLEHDPRQERPLGHAADDARAALREILAEHFANADERPIPTAHVPAELLERLRALGYID